MKNRLRIILAEQKKTIKNVHEATGVSKTTLTAIFYERSENPSVKTLKKVAQYLGVTLDELMGET